MCDEHDTSKQYYLQRSTKVCKRKPRLRQQNNRGKSYSNKPTSPPLVIGHTNYFRLTLTGDGCYENGHEDNDGVEEDKNSSHTSRRLVDSVEHADYSFDKDIGNSDDAAGESNGSENKDGHCILNGDSSKDAECQTGGANELGDRHGHDVDGNDDANIGNGNADHDNDNDGANAGSTVENDDDSDGGGGDGNKDSSGDRVRSQTIVITAGDNNGNTASYPPSLKPKTSSPRLPRGNWAELDYLYKSRIPSLEATGVNQKFLERHTTDLSLQNVSQPGDFNLPKNSTPPAEWPMWSLPPPDASETEHRWRHSSGLQPSVVGNQTGGQSNWQFWNQPSREMNNSNFNPQEQKSFNRIDPWFASGAEAFTGLRISDSLPATNGTISGSLFNTHAAMASSHEPKWRYSANNSYGSHLNSPTYRGLSVRDGPPVSRLPTVKSHAPVVCPSVTTPVTELQPTASVTSQSVPSYSYQSNVLPENLQERFMGPSFTENQEAIISSASRIEEQRAGTEASSLEFPDDPSLAALERKVAEACAVVERVMKEREERTKAQREAARKRREMREQREREAREMREREEREREERKMRERQEREIREREERDRSEQIENEDRYTRWFGGERAPVQESLRWQCEHYQRRCLVKFPCCGIFYPCHRERREREEREREERKMRERQEREIRERERREPVENEDRDTRWFGGERAPVQESPRWQCEHYQRRCLVKFPCCGIFYPCHRCHNSSGACDTDDRKANNATHVKCGICGHEEEVSGFVITVIPMNCVAHSRCA